jgi:hypothetical protein
LYSSATADFGTAAGDEDWSGVNIDTVDTTSLTIKAGINAGVDIVTGNIGTSDALASLTLSSTTAGSTLVVGTLDDADSLTTLTTNGAYGAITIGDVGAVGSAEALATVAVTATNGSAVVVGSITGDTTNSTVESRTITNGTGVTVTNGNGVSGNTTIAIGQDVSTTANVTFYDVNVNGSLNSNDITSANVTVSGNAIITGNLIVQGTTTTIQSTAIEVGDSLIVLNSLETSTPTLDAGVEVERGTAPNVKLLWKESTDRWTFTNDGSNYYNIPVSSEYNNYTYDISAVSVSANTAKLRLNGGGTTDDVNFVGTGTVLVTQTDDNTITINGVGSTEFEVTGITNSAASVVDTFVKTTYRSAEYTFTATVTTGTTHYVTGRILVIHNGTSAYNTQFAILSTNMNDDLVEFTADVNGSNVRLLAQATAGNVVKVKITGATYSTV